MTIVADDSNDSHAGEPAGGLWLPLPDDGRPVGTRRRPFCFRALRVS